MAGNEWLNGYLEAILDAGAKGLTAAAGARDDYRGIATGAGSSLVPGLSFSPTKYFIEEVVDSSEEADLHKTWVKVIATRNSRERNNRLENMCWRIWHLARRKKQIQSEAFKGLAKRRLEREKGRRDVSEDISELSEGEKGSLNYNNDSANGNSMSRSSSNNKSQVLLEEEDGEQDSTPRRLYVVLISLHGLVRGENMELGRDSDTGGQVKYVVELARALAESRGIYRVDLLTRQISSPDVDWSYGEPVEMLTRPSDADPIDTDGGGAYIIRLPCGPPDKYIAKESLWPYVPEFVDRALAHIMDVGKAMGEQMESASGKAVWPYVIHGNYADAGEVAARLSGALNVPMVLTGHSLGRNKLEQLLKQGRLPREEINATYRIMRRIEAEELALDSAEMVVTSTMQEIDEQWGLYDGFDLKLERKLRVRRKRGVSCLGRHMPRMVVIPPGMDFSYVNAEDIQDSEDVASLISRDRVKARRNLPPIWSEIMRFFTNPHKPMILALSRPDPKKNVTTLIKAFGESRHLRELANMTLILGNRDDVSEMAVGPSSVLTAVLKLIDKYDLYGSVAYPKHHKQSDVPEIYRLAAKMKGVFINPALVEPFGLTLIEAAAYGLPVVATKNGGPVDIIKVLNNGLLIDPHDHKATSEALLKLVADKALWQECRKNGLKNIHRFSWPEHCRNYLSHVEACRSRHPSTGLLLDSAAAPSTIQCPSHDDPLSDSLKDVDADLSIRVSVDASLDTTTADPATSVTVALLDAVRRRNHQPSSTSYSPGRRQRLAVIAVDCYDSEGRLEADELVKVVRRVMAAAAGVPDGSTGFVLMTGATVKEITEALSSSKFEGQFDALVCSGGSEIWFPWKEEVVSADVGYWAHVEYRWPGNHVKSAVPRLARLDGEDGAADEIFVLNAEASTSYCYAYTVRPDANAPKLDELKQRLRMRGFRCNLIYTHACTRLNVMPLFASRAHALRYLWIIWGIDLSKMVVFVGDNGDTDQEELLLGIQKVVILKGVVKNGSETLLRGMENYKREDVVSYDSPNIVSVDDDHSDDEMKSVLKGLHFK